MPTLPVLTWIGNAAAVLSGAFGAITRQTQQAGCSRQAAYQHADKVQQAVADAQLPGPSRDELLARQPTPRRREPATLAGPGGQHRLAPKASQRRFAVTAAACGVSLQYDPGPARTCCWAARAPAGPPWDAGWPTPAGGPARPVDRLDDACRSLVTTLCLDEIYCHHRPILVGVEPHSLACVVARRARGLHRRDLGPDLGPVGPRGPGRGRRRPGLTARG